ncbi:uncharacterized protein N7477_007964 [Penicillium maclennaniae]|uniref:uncharacterized protein n=1 Tax=Penicillium maclennaniae TaxID=1343394 RepID=UPI00253F8FE3|nr:uncharacterized protein N7477_007964 [Penicillium maclennaniae]KAJ5665516.1 hypothetical protein N7477_007964 [Penicillium maclennaniae]
MSFIAVKLLKLGFSEAKKHRAKKQAQQFQDPSVYPEYPQPYPMTEYPRVKGSKVMGMVISALRFFQFVFGLAVIGLYGQDVHHDKAKDTWHARWVFALIVGFLATSTAAIYMIVPFLTKKVNYRPSAKLQLPRFAWEFVLCVLWLTLFGIFGKLYIGIYVSDSSSESGKRDTTTSSTTTTSELGDASKINRMRHAVWVDLTNLVFWAVTASWALLKWLKARRENGPVVFDAEKEAGSI